MSKNLENEVGIMIKNDIYKTPDRGALFKRSVLLYKYIMDEIAKGNKLTIADQDGNILKEIVF